MTRKFDAETFREIAERFGFEEVEIEEFLGHPGFDTEPVTAVAFFTFPDAQGAARWLQGYGEMTRITVAKVGGKLLFAGRSEHHMTGLEHPFDGLSIAWYPSRRALADLLTDPDVVATLPTRKASGAEERLVLMTDLLQASQ